ncbi:MAG: hypothetical protein DDT37_01675 [Firmicutes bacterium]|nr:hypothetical protein [candidate division NPL-UPA2 bacterium]
MSIAITPQDIIGVGVVPVFVAAATAGNNFINDGRVSLEFVNGHTAAITITIDSHAACNQGFDHDLVFTVAVGTRHRTPAFEPGRYNRSDGRVYITYSLTTALTVGVFRS